MTSMRCGQKNARTKASERRTDPRFPQESGRAGTGEQRETLGRRTQEAGRQRGSPLCPHGQLRGPAESLKVLYDAGILDREEYAQRVARVKRQHAQSGSY